MNLQRDRFREEFNVSFVFIVPFFGLDYFIKRAPDFFDWRSGFFRFTPQKNYIVNLKNDFSHNSAQSYNELLDLRTFKKELDFDTDEKVRMLNKESLLLIELVRYEEAVVSYDKALEINSDDYVTWYNRGNALVELERHEEAVVSYDKALEINSDDHVTWYNRGNALVELERYKEAVVSYDKALEINPHEDLAWFYRACCLALLNKVESAIESLYQAIYLNREYTEIAKSDRDFDNIRNDERFQSLMNSPLASVK